MSAPNHIRGGVEGFDEAEVLLLLGGGEADTGRGLTLVELHCRGPLCGWLQRQFPGLSPEDVADVWGDARVNVLEALRGRRLATDRPLWPWLCGIARARAVDHTRRRAAREEALAAARRALSAPAARARALPGDVAGGEITALILQAIGALPGRQRVVLQVFVEHYPEATRMETLRREVSRVTGREETRASVKRALQEGRCKVRALLRGQGYAPDDP